MINDLKTYKLGVAMFSPQMLKIFQMDSAREGLKCGPRACKLHTKPHFEIYTRYFGVKKKIKKLN